MYKIGDIVEIEFCDKEDGDYFHFKGELTKKQNVNFKYGDFGCDILEYYGQSKKFNTKNVNILKENIIKKESK